MRIYLAAMFSDKDRIAQYGTELEAMGITFTSRWVKEDVPHTVTIQDLAATYHQETAAADIDDILSSDKMIMFCPTDQKLADVPVRSLARGGRHFEAGLFYGLILAEDKIYDILPRELILVGKRENVFHFLDGIGAAKGYPAIVQFDTWADAKDYLYLTAPKEEVKCPKQTIAY
jgi:hypothetical protein